MKTEVKERKIKWDFRVPVAVLLLWGAFIIFAPAGYHVVRIFPNGKNDLPAALHYLLPESASWLRLRLLPIPCQTSFLERRQGWSRVNTSSSLLLTSIMLDATSPHAKPRTLDDKHARLLRKSISSCRSAGEDSEAIALGIAILEMSEETVAFLIGEGVDPDRQMITVDGVVSSPRVIANHMLRAAISVQDIESANKAKAVLDALDAPPGVRQ